MGKIDDIDDIDFNFDEDDFADLGIDASDIENLGLDDLDDLDDLGDTGSTGLFSDGDDGDDGDESDEEYDSLFGADEGDEPLFGESSTEGIGEFEPIEEGEIDDKGYADGSLVDGNTLMEDDFDTVDNTNDFISATGDFVVMENSGTETDFELAYLDITNIGILKRIRSNTNVADLMKSIQNTGLLEPLVVAPTATEGAYVLLAGYRRILACARLGKRIIPCVINNKVSTPEIPVLEALYNHSKRYSIKEQVDYIEYLEKQKGIMSASMIEYLLQMNSGDYTKLKDILEDNDEDIVTKLYDGIYTIETAFKKLEQRRKKESQEEKAIKQTVNAYENADESEQLSDAGESMNEDGPALTDDEIKQITVGVGDLDDGLDETSLSDMVTESKNMEGFEPHVQKVGEREFIDPAIRKATLIRDKGTCQACKRGGPQFSDVLDLHHVVPVALSGPDTVDNAIMLCLTCHRMVHLFAYNQLTIEKCILEGDYDKLTEDEKEKYPSPEVFEDEKMRFKRIVRLGNVIREGMSMKGAKLDQYKKEHPASAIGRRMPGKNGVQTSD